MEVEPLVSVVTPVYNGEKFLAECIESVLRQTYRNYEYLIVNNCSTDRSLEIALSYANKDPRVQVRSNSSFVGVIENHNIAFNLISPGAKYCKVVSADDFLFPDCLSRMVDLGETNPSMSIIGSYQLSGSVVRWQGFRYPTAVLPGVGLCRQIFLGGDPSFGFGTPTSILYRADIVRESPAFYPNSSPHADTSACFRYLRDTDFGFVFQVLSYERLHEETQSSASAKLDRYSSAYLNDLIQYGPFYLTQDELARKVRETLHGYHRSLAVKYLFGPAEKQFWDYHRGRLQELGYPLRRSQLLRAVLLTVLTEILNPEQATRKLRKRLFPESPKATIPSMEPGSTRIQAVGTDQKSHQ